MSQKLFSKNGFDNISMEMIAKEAEVGTGTLYNYYKNKSEVFLESIQFSISDISNSHEYEFEVKDKYKADEIIIDYIESYLENIQWFFSKRLVRELISALASFGKKKNSMFEKLLQEDFKFIDNLETLIKKMIDAKIIDEHNNARLLAEITYSALIYDFFIYLYSDKESKDEMIDNIEKKIHYIFQERL